MKSILKSNHNYIFKYAIKKKKRQNTVLYERIGNEINKSVRFLLIYAKALPFSACGRE
jgi:hypothetical protein